MTKVEKIEAEIAGLPTRDQQKVLYAMSTAMPSTVLNANSKHRVIVAASGIP